MSFDYIYKVDRYMIAISEWEDDLYSEELALWSNDGKKMVFFGIVMKEDEEREVHVMNCACVRKVFRGGNFRLWIQKNDDCKPCFCETPTCSSISCSDCLAASGDSKYTCPLSCDKISSRNICTKKRRGKKSVRVDTSAITSLKKVNISLKPKKTLRQPREYPLDIARIMEKIKIARSRKRGRKPVLPGEIRKEDRVCYYEVEKGKICGETSASWKNKNPTSKHDMKWIEHPVGSFK